VPIVARINAEEALLIDAFGQDYQKYRGETDRLVPGIY
jgi:protein-S-isoprenylcysteine O-methyltransferase Ste14